MIRQVNEKDEKQLLELLTHFFVDYERGKIIVDELQPFEEYKNLDEGMNKTTRDYVNFDKEKELILVAEEKGKLVGYIYGRVIDVSHKVLEKKGFLEDWFVEEEYRGNGIGMRLYNQLVDWFKQKGCDHLETDTYALNNKEAINLYHKMGFIDYTIHMYKKL